MVLELTDCGASFQAAGAGSKGGSISNGIPYHASEAGMDSVPVHQHAYGGSLQRNRSTHPHSVHRRDSAIFFPTHWILPTSDIEKSGPAPKGTF